MTNLWFSQQLTMKRITALLVIEDLPYLPWIMFSISCISQPALNCFEPFRVFLGALSSGPHSVSGTALCFVSRAAHWLCLRVGTGFIYFVCMYSLPVFFPPKWFNHMKCKLFSDAFLVTPFPKLFFHVIVLCLRNLVHWRNLLYLTMLVFLCRVFPLLYSS